MEGKSSKVTSYYDSKFAPLCSLIMAIDVEDWEKRNKPMCAMTDLLREIDQLTGHEKESIFKASFFKLVKDPVKSMILDLRSQQVRDTCLFLTSLAKVGADLIKPLWKEIFRDILKAVQMPNKVMSSMVDDCIIEIIRHSTFKSVIVLLISEYKESRSKSFRENCLRYINEILICWELSDKEAEVISEVIRWGLEDASCGSREIARLAYINLFSLFPKKAERLKAAMPSSQLVNRLVKAELEAEALKRQHSSPGRQWDTEVAYGNSMIIGNSSAAATSNSNSSSATYSSSNSSSHPSSNRPNPAAQLRHLPAKTLVAKEIPKQHKSSNNNSNNSSSNNHNSKGSKNNSKRMSLHATRLDPRETAATCIQALFRGALTRKLLPEIIEAFREVNGLDTAAGIENDFYRSNNENNDHSNSSNNNNGNNYNDSSNNLMNNSIDITPNVLYKEGDLVSVCALHPSNSMAVVKFVGCTSFADGLWVGVQLKAPVGKNNGIVDGVQYFECPNRYGLFVRPRQLQLVAASNTSSNTVHDGEEVGVAAQFSRPIVKMGMVDLAKVKIMQSMELLRKQLSIVEDLERLQASHEHNVNSMVENENLDLNSASKDRFKELYRLCEEEQMLLGKYRSELRSFQFI